MTRVSPAAAITSANSVAFGVTFSEAVTGVQPSSFVVTRSGPVTTSPTVSVLGSGAAYTVTVTGIRGNGTVGLSLVDNDTIVDGAHVPLGGVGLGNGSFTGPSYTIQGQVLPQVVSITRTTPASQFTGGANRVTYTVTFNRAVTGVDPSDFQTVTTGDVTAGSITTMGSGSSYQVTVSGIAGSGTLGLNLMDNGTIHDLLGAPLVQPSAGPAFANAVTYGTGTANAFSLAAGDLTGTGTDALVVPSGDYYVTVLLPDGHGGFQGPQALGTYGTARYATIADVNGDGKADIIVGGGAGVGVFLGNGHGTFQPEHLVYGGPAHQVAVADVNGDGKPDLVTNYWGGYTVLLGNGNGTFRALASIPGGADDTFGTGLVLADLNGDNVPDLVVASRLGNWVGVYMGNGNGTFQTPLILDTGVNSLPGGITVADVNGDGHPDIIEGNSGVDQYGQDINEPSVGIFLGNGNGTFQNLYKMFAAAIVNVAAVDINGDGKLDVVATGADVSGNLVSVLTGNGDGTFAYPQGYHTNPNPLALAVTDTNGDGRPDLVVGAYDAYGNYINVLSNTAGGSASGPLYIAAPLIAGETGLDIQAPAQPISYGATGTVTVTVGSPSGTPTGNVILTVDGGTTFTRALANGTATFTLLGLGAGSHNLDASYAAQNGFLASANSSVLVVTPVATTTTLVAPSVPYGSTATVTVTVSAALGVPTPLGSVTLTVNGTPLAAQTLSAQGTAVFTIPSAAASNLAASYSAQGNYAASSANGILAVTTVATTTALSAPSVTVGANGVVTVTVAGGSGGPAPTGSVALSLDGTAVGTQTLSTQGTAVFVVAGLAAGSHAVQASYAAQGSFGASSATGTLTVSAAGTTTILNAPSVAAGSNATVTVTVVAVGQPTPTGTVTVTLDGNTLGSASLSAQGTATFTVTSPAAGSHTLSATYTPSTGSNYAGSTGAGTLLVGTTSSAGDLTVGSVLFRPEGGTFVPSGSTYTATGPVAVGYAPPQGQAFQPLLILNGSTVVDTAAGTVQSTGAVATAIDGSGTTLLGALPLANIAALTGAAGITGLTGSPFAVAGVPFTPSSLGFTNGTGGPQLRLQGALALPVGLTVAVGGTSAVTVGGSGIALTAFTATAVGTLTVAGVGFASSQFTVQYNSAADSFTVTGQASAAITGVGGLSVSLGGGSTAGLVLTHGALTALSMTVSAQFTVGSYATFTAHGLTLTYAAANAQYTVSGNASAAIGPSPATPVCALDVTFGSGSTPGIVITGGALTSLNFTVSSTVTLQNLSFNAAGLWFTYSAAADQFMLISGAASLSVGGVTTGGQAGLNVTFGAGATPGLVVTHGALTSLYATVNADFTVHGLTFFAGNLVFTYAGGTFTMNGSTGVSLLGLAKPLQVTFGYTDTNGVAQQGLVVTNGQLRNLHLLVNAMFKVSSVSVYADNLTFDYTASSGVFAMSGTAEVAVGGMLGALTGDHIKVNFAPVNGLVVTNGALTSLNMTVNGTFKVGTVSISADSLNFTYTASTSQFDMSGTAKVSMKFVAAIEVTFGTTSAPGLVLTGGTLSSLNMTVFAGFVLPAIPSVTPAIQLSNLPNLANLTFTYTASTQRFTMAGTAGLILPTAPGIPAWLTGQGVQVTFNGPGLVVTDGDLTTLDMTLNTNLTEAGVGFRTQGLNVTYDAAGGVFTMEGAASFNVSYLGTVGVTFGGGSTKGLVITDGQLTNLDMTVNGTFGVGGLGFSLSNVVMTYNGAANTFTMTGAASLGVPYVGGVSVILGGNGTSGLVLTNGNLTALSMAVGASFSVGGVSFAPGNLSVTYSAAQNTFTMTGGSSFYLLNYAAVSAQLGGTGTQGLVIHNGSLSSLNLTVAANITIVGLGINGNLVMTYSQPANTFTLTGAASLNVGNVFSLSATLGGPGTAGLVLQNGGLQALSMTVSGNFSMLGLGAGVSLTATYNPGTHVYKFAGTALATFGTLLPSWAQSFLGSGTISVGCEIYYDANNTPGSFVNVYTTILGDQIGLQVFFNGTVDVTMGDPFGAAFQEIAYVASQAYAATATSFVQAYEQAAGGATNVYNVTASALDSAFQAASSAASNVISDIVDFFSSLGNLSGATVYYDAGNDFALATDPSAVTAGDGSFQLLIPDGSTGGQLVVVGGTDLSTGMANRIVLTAPLGSALITPLTSLVNGVMRQTGVGTIAANTTVTQALGIPSSINLTTQEILKLALAGDAASAGAFAVEVQISALANEVVGLLGGAGGPSDLELSQAFFGSLAAELAQATGPYDLADAASLQALLTATASAAGVSVDGAVAAGAAEVMAAVNQFIQGIPVAGGATYLDQIVQAQVVASGTIATQLAQVEAGAATIDQVVADHTGAALAAEIAAATPGSLDQDGPTLSITQTVVQAVGNGDASAIQFTVYLTTTTPLSAPVTVNFTTVDGTATVADGDYDAISGTLTWLPGDTAPQTITIPVHPGTTWTPDRQFKVVLSGATTATIQSGTGVGDLWFTDIGTSTDLSSTASEANMGDAVTLTATVTNQDAALDAGTGLVVFADGATVLGSAPLVGGVASLTLTDLRAGSHSFTAAYQGFAVLGAHYDASGSPAVSVLIDAAPQSITFDPLPDHTYGDLSFELSATAASGLPVTFTILAGPATLNGDLLTITGAGTVTIEADQAGDDDYQPAPAVVQSFTVNPASLLVVVDNQAARYGDSIPVLTDSISGFVNGDDATSLYALPTLQSVSTGSAVGSYAIHALNGSAANYTFVYVDGTLTITPAPLVISGGEPSAPYGSVPLLTASYSGLVNGDTPASLTTPPTLSTTAVAGSPVGTYAITVDGAVDPNYSITYLDGILTVTPPPLPAVGVPGQALTVTLTPPYGTPVEDLADDFTFTVNWGDGQSDILVGPGGSTATHVYHSTGAFPVQVTVTDGTGQSSVLASQVVTLSDAVLEADGLHVAGTSAALGVLLTPDTTPGSLKVWRAGTLLGTFAPAGGAVTIDGDGGTDLVILRGPAGSADAFTLTGQTATLVTAAPGSTAFTLTLDNISLVTLHGGNVANTFTNTAAAVASRLVGGTGQNLFKLAGNTPGAPVAIQGMGNNNTLIGPDQGPGLFHEWTIGRANGGTLDGPSWTFAGVQNLMGGGGNNRFHVLRTGSLTGLLEGGSGPLNLLSYAGDASAVLVNLQTNTATGVGSFANIESLVGAGAASTLLGADGGSAWQVTGANTGRAGTLAFSGFANLTGGTGSDFFAFLARGSLTGTLDGGGGLNTVSYAAAPAALTVDLAHGTAVTSTGAVLTAGLANVGRFVANPAWTNTLLGPNVNTIWQIGGTNQGRAGAVAFENFANVTGGTAVDYFRFTPGTGRLTGMLDGGGGGDVLYYLAYTDGVVVNLATGVATATGGVRHIHEVLGGSGDDALTADDQGDILVGNDGNDTLIGGAGHDILLGGAGDDLLIAGSGRAVLVGGSGSDTLQGGGADDVLIGGLVAQYNEATHFVNVTALNALLAAWSSNQPYLARIAQLQAQPHWGLNAQTVSDDGGAVDQLFGGAAGSLDWFWTSSGDTVTKNDPAEVVTTV
jgi:hypothetical protein